MLTRRDFLQVAAAAATILPGGLARASGVGQGDLLAFKPVGQVTLLSITDLHAQLMPLYYREPAVNIGVGAARGLPPHLTGRDFLRHFHLKAGSRAAYLLTSDGFTELARHYGRVGGLDRIATLVKAIRAERPDNTLLIDSGDTWQGSYTALASRGGDMVAAMKALGVDVMTGHWEFTLGAARVKQIVDNDFKGKVDFVAPEPNCALPETSSLVAGATVPMPTLPPATTKVEPPTEKALPEMVTVEADRNVCGTLQLLSMLL